MDDETGILALSVGAPERALVAGEVLYGQGHGGDRSVAVLVEGALRVELDGVELAEIDVPGAFVGEIGALLGSARTATVVASAPSVVRVIGDPDAFFRDDPRLGLELARQLAGRLHRLLVYLGDVRSQYAGADGHLGVLDAVLARIAARPPVEIEPGSDRAGDYDA